jgi:hypothetical protein
MKGYSKGLTIIEAVVSIMIVGFSLVGMLQLYSVGAIQANITRHKVMAVNKAQEEMEFRISLGFDATNPGIYSDIVKIDTGKTNNTSDDINGTMVTNIVSVSEGYKVTVTVSWNDHYGAMSEIAESMITSYE